MEIQSDLHIHTTLSSCCADPAQTPENILSLLSGRGFRKIAFTDHLWENPAVPPSPWYAAQGSARILRMADSARKAAKEHSMTLLIGCETDMCAPGKFGITPQIREKFDFVQMASDHFHMREFVEQPEEEDFPEDLPSACSSVPGSAAGDKQADSAESSPALRGKTTVELSPLVRPGAIASGSVKFGSGASADWFLDQQGRLGLEKAKGQPDRQDIQEFQIELQKALGV